MLSVSRQVFQFFIGLGNIVLPPQGDTPKSVDQRVALAHLLEPMANLVIERDCAFELASFRLLQHKFRSAKWCEQILARVGSCQNRQDCPQRKQNRIDDCRREITPAARFKHATQRFTERSRRRLAASEGIPKTT